MTSANWIKLEGYDERLEGYGSDDNDMAARIRQAGIEVYNKH
jgi:predicted glycosyltransferase involved in capsule biosynthesis